MFRVPYLSLALLLSLAIGSCSGVDPSEEVPACGAQLTPDQVTILDLRPVVDQPEMVDAFIREQIGEYRLITTTPIGIDVRNSNRYGSRYEELQSIDGLEGIGLAQIEAADRGCDLLLIVERKTVAPKRGGHGTIPNSANTGRRAEGVPVWIVHMGRREAE